MKISLFYALRICLLLSCAHITCAQDKTLTEPIELIKAPQPTNGATTSSQYQLYCGTPKNSVEPLFLVDGKEKTLAEIQATVKPDSIKSMQVVKPRAPEAAAYGARGKNGIILIETLQASNKSSRKKSQ